MSDELDKKIAASEARFKKLHAELKTAQDRRDDWKAGQLGVALAYEKGTLLDLYSTREASRPAGGAIRPSGVFYGSNS